MKFENLPVDKEIKRFKSHLEDEANERIILSGIFGIGKTYFINQFFNEFSEEYIQVRLNPVNYSVSQNEDIFQLIKFDIAFQLLAQKDLKMEKLQFSSGTYSEYFLTENFKSVITDLAKSLSKIDQRIDAIVAPALKLAERIEEEKEKIEFDEKETLLRFLNTFSAIKGSIREEDDITLLINHLVQGLKGDETKKKIVLAIDDLDRIDPEHIFRILNVFSAHFDFIDGQNKFDFDQVIIICDIDNIRGIFHNKYGTDIDFSGYIDKFYSREVFYYDFSKVISDHTVKFLFNIQIPDDSIQEQLTSRAADEYLRDELAFILKYMILSNAINMRMLVNFLKGEVNLQFRSFMFDSYRVSSKSTSILIILEILERLFGGKDNTLAALAKTYHKFPFIFFTPFNPWLHLRIGNLLMLIEYKKTYLKPSKGIEKYEDKELDFKASYSITNYSNGLIGRTIEIGSLKDELVWQEDISHPVEKLKKKNLPYFQLLRKAFLAKQELINSNSD